MSLHFGDFGSATPVHPLLGGVTTLVRNVPEGGEAVEHIEVGVKPKDLSNPRSFHALLRSIPKTAAELKKVAIVIDFKDFADLHPYEKSAYELARTIAENLSIGLYDFNDCKSEKSETAKLSIFLSDVTVNAEVERGFKDGQVVGVATSMSRRWADLPRNILYPASWAEEIKNTFAGNKKIEIRILDEDNILAEKMGLLYAVGQGAKREHGPRLVVILYMGDDTPNALFDFLVGKGITFDTGGIDLKISHGANGMQRDMSGGAAAVAALWAAAELGEKRNIGVVVPMAENAIGSNAYTTTDIITSMSGCKIAVDNTDAEGRLVLADALSYVAKHFKGKVRSVTTIATLTGACRIALGTFSCGLFTENYEYERSLRELSWKAGDYLHPLPAGSEYDCLLDSYSADRSNVQPNGGREGGASVGFRFLVPFADEVIKGSPGCLFSHVDCAPLMTGTESAGTGKGSSGSPVRFLVRRLCSDL